MRRGISILRTWNQPIVMYATYYPVSHYLWLEMPSRSQTYVRWLNHIKNMQNQVISGT